MIGLGLADLRNSGQASEQRHANHNYYCCHSSLLHLWFAFLQQLSFRRNVHNRQPSLKVAPTTLLLTCSFHLESLKCFLLLCEFTWHWTLTYDLRTWPRWCPAEPACQVSRSKVISFKSDIQTDTHNWPTAIPGPHSGPATAATLR